MVIIANTTSTMCRTRALTTEAARPIRIGFPSLPLACRQGGVVYTNTTFPIAFSSCLAIEVTAYGTANTQNNLRVTANSNTGFSFYTNDYTPRYLAVGY